MKPKTFAGLALLTFLMVVLAVIAVVLEDNTQTVLEDRKPAFPRLVERINEATSIEIGSKDGKFTVTGGGDTWGVVEKNDYPVKRETVRDFLLSLANLRLVEAKTSRQDRYERLEVEDIEADDAESRSVTVRDGDGRILADGIIGRRKYFLYVDGRGGTYLRRAGELQSWLAEGEMDFGALPFDWLDRLALEVPAEEVQELTIAQPDSETLVLQKDEPGQEHFSVIGAPEDGVLKTESEADRLAFVVRNFEFDDVEPIEKVSFEDGPLHTATYTTFDGLRIVIELASKEIVSLRIADNPPMERWARIRAEVAEDAAEESRAAVTARADEINASTGAWAYKVDELMGNRLTKRRAQLYKEPDS